MFKVREIVEVISKIMIKIWREKIFLWICLMLIEFCVKLFFNKIWEFLGVFLKVFFGMECKLWCESLLFCNLSWKLFLFWVIFLLGFFEFELKVLIGCILIFLFWNVIGFWNIEWIFFYRSFIWWWIWFCSFDFID